MRILTFTNLFPNSVQPRHGIFVERRLQHLVETGMIQARVLAPVPWFPFSAKKFGSWSMYSGVEKFAQRGDIEIVYPRYPVIPKVGMHVAPMLMALAVRRTVKRILESGYDFQLFDAHYFYPDGVAAVILGRWFGKPVVITARGSDVNILPKYPLVRKWIKWAARECDAIVTVSNALNIELQRMEFHGSKISTLRNGVDHELFCPRHGISIREDRQLAGPLILSVGNLTKQKGHDIVVGVLQHHSDLNLIIIGSGPEHAALHDLAVRLGVSNRMVILNNMPPSDLVDYYNAADAVVLASESEGMPNVLLESMACGTPVVASDVGGIPEIVAHGVSGELVSVRCVEEFSSAVGRVLTGRYERSKVRLHSMSFSWPRIIDLQVELYQRVISEQAGNRNNAN